MRRALWILALLLITAPAQAVPPPDDTCLRRGGDATTDVSLRCRGTGAGGSGPPRLFAYGCYYGDGEDARLIHTGIPADVAGMTMVNKVSTSETFCNRWRIPEMGGTLSRGQGNCTTNELNDGITGWLEDGFTIDESASAGDSVNEDLEAFCWYQWSQAPGWHGTFTYTGDGTTPRTLSLPGAGALDDGALVLIQNRNNGDGPVSANLFTMKTSDMAATQSVVWDQATASASDAQMIRALGNSQVDLGSSLNESGVTYYGAWWNLTNPLEGGTIDWTGDGTDGGNNCAVNDGITFGPAACEITGILTGEDFFDEGGSPGDCAHQECDGIRAENISINLAGAGHISGNDFYIQPSGSPDDEGLRLLNGSFEVIGGPATEMSCNDNTQSYFAAYWCKAAPSTVDTPVPTVTRTPTATITQTPTITPTPANTPTATATSSDSAPLDWSGSFLAVWEMDEASGATRASTGTCVADCALANNNNVLLNSTAGQFAFGTGGAQSDTGGSEYLSCAASTCNEISLNAVAAATWGCYGYVANDSDTGTLLSWTTSAIEWNLQRSTVNNQAFCQIREADESLITAGSANSSWPAANLVFAACTFDDANNELKAYIGNTPGSAVTATDIESGTGGNFQATGGDFNFVGTTDTCFVEDHELTDEDLCRICSCGINGALGACICTGGGASYSNTGLNAAECGSCTLPACNKAAPD